MSPVSRETVIAAVATYGEAWVSQDTKKIGALFTEDAVYVERAFDRKATFRGRAEIEKYWNYQICGKQTNILFRHIESEMVRDADSPIAVVKWLAEFDNRRENRSGKANKRVRFCQMAKLVFQGNRISYLEEYAQGMEGPAVRWPGIQATDYDLWERIRFEPEKSTPPVVCERCNGMFPSRTKLFQHLRETDEGADGSGCVPNAEAKARMQAAASVLVCLSLSYSCHDPEQQVLQALMNAIPCKSETETETETETNSSRLIELLTWAVPPDLASSALVNVVTVKLCKRFVEQWTVGHLPNLLNQAIQKSSSGGRNGAGFVKFHSAGIVDRPCAPERREYEKYVVFIPWEFINVDEETKDRQPLLSTHSGPIDPCPLERPKQWRKPLEATSAFEFLGTSSTLRLKKGARLMKDGCKELGHFVDKHKQNEMKIRVRTSTMEEPWHRLCRISISMYQPKSGYVEYLLGLLVAFARNEVPEDKFIAMLMDVADLQTDLTRSPLPFPSELVILLEPSLTKYENKARLALCRGSYNVSCETMRSIESAESQILLEVMDKSVLLEKWVNGRNRLEQIGLTYQ
jgi:ketosteroid isomerase-like protein